MMSNRWGVVRRSVRVGVGVGISEGWRMSGVAMEVWLTWWMAPAEVRAIFLPGRSICRFLVLPLRSLARPGIAAPFLSSTATSMLPRVLTPCRSPAIFLVTILVGRCVAVRAGQVQRLRPMLLPPVSFLTPFVTLGTTLQGSGSWVRDHAEISRDFFRARAIWATAFRGYFIKVEVGCQI